MKIGLGMAALGRPGYINLQRNTHLTSRTIEGMQQQANAVIDELFQQCLEINKSTPAESDGGKIVPWLDCARSYGLSEKFVGEYLRENNVRPEDVYVSSKWGYTYVADWKVELGEREPHEVKDHSLENFMKQVQETDSHIGPYLNLYQVHSATFDSGILTNTQVHEALHKCRVEKGWKLGLSMSGPNQDEIIREALKINVGDEQSTTATPSTTKQKHTRLFDSVQCTYNILEQRPGPALMEAHNAGMDIIIKEGLANGRALLYPKLAEMARRVGCSTDALALGAILAQPFQPRVLSGAVTKEQLRSNLDALSVAEKLMGTEEGKEVLKELMDECKMESEEYWKERSALKWN
mmetsp:Transcript_7519/g.16319  ORF Transcript_7519/g.16319 Transcript_7519/m.16319 type:complete len:351 (+) Transcript_7519:107-1159(+)